MSKSMITTMSGAYYDQVRRRIVRVFVTDPDPDLPLEHCVVYGGTELLTEDTDAELVLALNIPKLIADHNEKRRAAELKEIKWRDLRQVIATVVYV